MGQEMRVSANQPTQVLGGVVGIFPTTRRPAYARTAWLYNIQGACVSMQVCLFDNAIRRHARPWVAVPCTVAHGMPSNG